MARQPRNRRIQLALQGGAFRIHRQFFRHIAQQRCGIGGTEQGWQAPHQNRTSAEAFDLQAQARQRIRRAQKPRRIGRRHIHHRRHQQRLGAHAAIAELRAKRLMRQAFMRGVLIHQHQRPISGFGDNESVQYLRHGTAQGMRGIYRRGCVWRRQAGRAETQRQARLRQPCRARHKLGQNGQGLAKARNRRGAGQGRHRHHGPSANRERFAERGYQGTPHSLPITEAEFGLHRMHIHIHGLRRHLQEQRCDWVAALRDHIAVSHAQRHAQQRVAHRAAVHHQMLAKRGRAVVGRQRRKPADIQVLGDRFHRHRGGSEIRPEHLPYAPFLIGGGQGKHFPPIAFHAKRHFRPGQRQAAHRFHRVFGFRARML